MAYVYAILVDDVTRYIGKGNGRRAVGHIALARAINAKRATGKKVRALRFHNKLAKAIRDGAVVEHAVLASGMTDDEAFAEEIKQIAAQRGVLWNEQVGGQGLSSADAKRLARRMRRRKGYKEKTALRVARTIGHPNSRALALERTLRPEAREQFKRSMASYWASSRFKKTIRANGRKVAADPILRQASVARMKRMMATPEAKAIIAASNKRRMTDPEQRATTIAMLAAARDRNNNDPLFQAKRRAGIQAYWEAWRGNR